MISKHAKIQIQLISYKLIVLRQKIWQAALSSEQKVNIIFCQVKQRENINKNLCNWIILDKIIIKKQQ